MRYPNKSCSALVRRSSWSTRVFSEPFLYCGSCGGLCDANAAETILSWSCSDECRSVHHCAHQSVTTTIDKLGARKSTAGARIQTAVSCVRTAVAAAARYSCMHEHTAQREAAGLPVLQYYGKWPFVRLGTVQEPAAALFSLLNLLAHARGIRRLLCLPRGRQARENLAKQRQRQRQRQKQKQTAPTTLRARARVTLGSGL